MIWTYFYAGSLPHLGHNRHSNMVRGRGRGGARRRAVKGRGGASWGTWIGDVRMWMAGQQGDAAEECG